MSRYVRRKGGAGEPELELLTIDELRSVLDVADDRDLKSMASFGESEERGFVARNKATGVFQVVTRAGVTELCAQNRIGMAKASNEGSATRHSDEIQWISLASTQVLRRMLATDTDSESDRPD